MPETGLIYVAAIILVGFYIAYSAIKIVREYQRLVIFRLGKCIGQKGPGIVWLWPFVDRAVWVDLREVFLEIPSQTCITRDNAPINIDFLIYWKVVDPVNSVIAVGDFAGAARGIATTTLRAVIGDIILDDVLARREQINQVLRSKLDEVTERWGVKVTTVEIREILPPKDVQEAMTRQMSAERTRRAVVTEADGKKQATITVAEGERQSVILRAEGDRQAAILRAEGFALALDKIFSVAKTVDSKTMALQYLETLKALGAGAATKIIFPMEFTKLLEPLVEMTDRGFKKEP
ncbi:MAG: SPFH domain-containing protein [Armatimonadota bacterium]|nr:SPFH domain-containing protein [Armatimonadota bacterium]MDR7518295.1 SPFH domain-containing protein [Armatimonadota bacterium]MDR7549945.1 SPFH domain-containing protein [Armatimonadota bacterium]